MKTFATIALVAFCSRWCIAAGFHYLLEGHADPSAPVIERRGRGTASGEVLHPAGLILPADRLFREFVLDAETLQVGYADFVSPAVGLSMELPTFDLGPDPWGDADGDGLGGMGEYIVGTDPSQWDTDGDNVSDAAGPSAHQTSRVYSA